MTSPLDSLTQINLDDLVASFGWQDSPLLARLLRRLFLQPARTFARQMVEFDEAVAARGLTEAARLTQRHFVRSVRVFGLELVPASAFLALSNHPGMSDTLSIFGALNRTDLKIIALDRPFPMALPNMSRQLFFVREDPAARMTLVRQVSGHLRSGGAALTFPAGHIEPDPDVYPGAVESLQNWTDSVGVFIRMAPETAILPIFVRGVIWDKTAKHWLLAIKKTRQERDPGRGFATSGARGFQAERCPCAGANRQADLRQRVGHDRHAGDPSSRVGRDETPDRESARG